MSSTSYQRGRDAEYRVCNELNGLDYVTGRFAGSHGSADVIAWNTEHLRFIQVKTYKDRSGDYTGDIVKLLRLPKLPNASAELWVRQIGQAGWKARLLIRAGTFRPDTAILLPREPEANELAQYWPVIPGDLHVPTSERAVSDPLHDHRDLALATTQGG